MVLLINQLLRKTGAPLRKPTPPAHHEEAALFATAEKPRKEAESQ